MAIVIETSNLYKSYKKRSFFKKNINEIVAVNNINLKVEKGEICGLLGRNGAGKTTLLKMLSTLILPTSGTAKVNNFDILKDPARVRSCIGLVSSDERSFYWRLNGKTNLLFFALLQNIPLKIAKEKISFLLNLVGLTDKGNEMFQTYSSGMKQKLAIARGLLHNPDILLMDEPTKGLDPETAHNIRMFIRKELVNKNGITVLVVTHDLNEVEEICNTVIIMHKGSILIKEDQNYIPKDLSLKKLFIESINNVKTTIN